MATENKEIEVGQRPELLVWYELIYHDNCGFGIGEEELLKVTGLARPSLYKILTRLIDSGLVEHRLQQIGTGGTQDHFYKLKEKHAIYVRPKQPK